jgi:cytochrome c551/c552
MPCQDRGKHLVKRLWLSGLMVLLIGLASCNQSLERTAAALTGGNPGRGKEVIRQYGCGSCHTIPGIQGAHALVGPSLAQVASRMYIAGVATQYAHEYAAVAAKSSSGATIHRYAQYGCDRG